MSGWLAGINIRRTLSLCLAVVASAYVGWRFQPMMSENTDAIDTVVTIFSILAGFLIAVITFIADPLIRQAKNWEELRRVRRTLHRKLLRHALLFFLYLCVLALALALYIIPKDAYVLLRVAQTCFLGVSTFVFLASFTLPYALMKLQLDRYEAELRKTEPEVFKQAKAARKNVEPPSNSV